PILSSSFSHSISDLSHSGSGDGARTLRPAAAQELFGSSAGDSSVQARSGFPEQQPFGGYGGEQRLLGRRWHINPSALQFSTASRLQVAVVLDLLLVVDVLQDFWCSNSIILFIYA
ncbi:unnamed protein product, partial [Urochloa humidicola]